MEVAAAVARAVAVAVAVACLEAVPAPSHPGTPPPRRPRHLPQVTKEISDIRIVGAFNAEVVPLLAAAAQKKIAAAQAQAQAQAQALEPLSWPCASVLALKEQDEGCVASRPALAHRPPPD